MITHSLQYKSCIFQYQCPCDPAQYKNIKQYCRALQECYPNVWLKFKAWERHYITKPQINSSQRQQSLDYALSLYWCRILHICITVHLTIEKFPHLEFPPRNCSHCLLCCQYDHVWTIHILESVASLSSLRIGFIDQNWTQSRKPVFYTSLFELKH